jgi:asparagine synthase (glutamine-hydrolysing)
MCGICGVWEYGAAEARIDEPLLVRMRDTMAHRGPDSTGAHMLDEGRLGLGFRRLAIVDLSPAGNQPMRGCARRDVWLIFNGEIYNHALLREDLERRGHVYASRTDSETILHLYEERGLDFVSALEGDFAITLWDAARERLVLARDPLGVKPLYFYQRDGRFIFASEIKAILAHPTVIAEVDEDSLYHYLSFLTSPAPNTLFRDIKKLPAGHLLTVERDGTTRTTRYFDPLPPAEPIERSDEEWRAELMRLLRASVKKRMMADVPVGVFLSGGVDSSANVALMAEASSRPVRTFTVGFSDADEYNELDAARAVAEKFGTEHHEVVIDESEMRSFLADLVFHQDEPIADPVCVPLYYVSKLARETGTIVVQSGEGADEILSGYEKYVRYLKLYERYWRHAERLPRVARRTASAGAQALLETFGAKSLPIELARRFGAGEELFWGAAIVFDETSKPRLLSTQMRERFAGRTSYEAVAPYLEHVARERPASDFLSRMIYLELQLRLPELLLMRVDKITMATSVETRVPFLDDKLVTFASGLPRALKVKGESGKHVLKQALEEVLPRELLRRRKRGFGAPIKEWLRDDPTRLLDSHVLNSKMRRREFFDYSYIARLVEEHRSGAHDWSFHLWTLLNLSAWYERWIERAR